MEVGSSEPHPAKQAVPGSKHLKKCVAEYIAASFQPTLNWWVLSWWQEPFFYCFAEFLCNCLLYLFFQSSLMVQHVFVNCIKYSIKKWPQERVKRLHINLESFSPHDISIIKEKIDLAINTKPPNQNTKSG